MEDLIEDMRWQLYKAYPGTDWQADVACMNRAEVRKCYTRCLHEGRIKEKK